MLSKDRRDFLWHVSGMAILVFAAAFGAHSGSCAQAISEGAPTAPWWSLADWWIAVLTAGLVLVGAGQAALFLWQLRLIRGSLADSRRAADAAAEAAKAAVLNAEAVKLAERAYLKLSHHSASERPALLFEENGKFSIKVRVKNHGRTPATVRTARFTYLVLVSDTPPPAEPNYEAGRQLSVGTGAFLVTEDYYNHTCVFGPLKPGERTDIESGKMVLWFYGHADYRDLFGSEHRSGYGRVFRPKGAEKGNNLIFSPALERYNDDKPRPEGEPNTVTGVWGGFP